MMHKRITTGTIQKYQPNEYLSYLWGYAYVTTYHLNGYVERNGIEIVAAVNITSYEYEARELAADYGGKVYDALLMKYI